MVIQLLAVHGLFFNKITGTSNPGVCHVAPPSSTIVSPQLAAFTAPCTSPFAGTTIVAALTLPAHITKSRRTRVL
jgi:hypothetical protein